MRAPVAADYVTLASWIPDAASCLRWAGPKLSFPFTPAQLAEQLSSSAPNAHSIVMSLGHGEALGFAQFWVRQAGTVHLGRIIVAPTARGQGLGLALCRLLMAEASRSRPVQAFTLRVYRDNPAALDIYTGLGFAVVPGLSDDKVLAMRMVPAAPLRGT
ncbi:GNAT family N-acetyltransferase [Polaromonas jejuensis]|uniref:GNAT family N-acetyltransferase n=1 Tax=Polaromonas jejuensis TaxID=457502 RepID=A0ABW0QF11_9BURK